MRFNSWQCLTTEGSHDLASIRSVKTGGVDIVVEEAGMNRYANGEL